MDRLSCFFIQQYVHTDPTSCMAYIGSPLQWHWYLLSDTIHTWMTVYFTIIKEKHNKRARNYVCQFDLVLTHHGRLIEVVSLFPTLQLIVLDWSLNALWYTACTLLYLLILVFERSSIPWGSHSSFSLYCFLLSSIFCTSFLDTLSVTAFLLLFLIFQYIK